MDTYIVRIYRRDQSDPRVFAGIVEEPEVPEGKAFTNIDELLSIFSRGSFPRPKKKRKRRESLR